MVFLLIWNLLPVARMLLRMPKKPETADQDQRTPEEASALARSVMTRMLATPPTPHVQKKPKKKSRQK
jgi:hypothetical protein